MKNKIDFFYNVLKNIHYKIYIIKYARKDLEKSIMPLIIFVFYIFV